MKQAQPEQFMSKAKIYPFQFFAMLTMVTICANLFVSPSAYLNSAGRAAWVVLLLGYLAGLVLLLAAWGLARYFPNECLPEYLPRLLGKVPGKAFALMLALALLINTVEDARVSVDAVAVGLFVYTPIPVTAALFIGLATYLAWTGPLRVARFAPFFLLVVLATFASIMFLTREWMQWGFLRPWLDFTDWQPATLPFWAGVATFRPLIILTLFYPYVQDQRRVLPLGIAALTVATLVIGLATLVPVAVFGLEGARMTARPFAYLTSIIFFADAPIETFDFFARLGLLDNSIFTVATLLCATARLVRITVAKQMTDGPFVWGLGLVAWAMQVPIRQIVTFRTLAEWIIIFTYLAGLSVVLLIPLAARYARRQQSSGA